MVVSPEGSFVDSKGSSRGISNELDRSLIVHLRSLSDVYVTGGNTARNEAYKVKEKPVLAVITATDYELPGAIMLTPPVGFSAYPWVIATLTSRGFERILLEVGPSLAKEFLAGDLVDEFCLTLPSGTLELAEKVLEDFHSSLNLSSSEEIDGTLFTRWRRGNDSQG
ncbi:MAG: hypothetical protein RLZZ56_197 [Actinomycetota bacterium]